MNDILIVGIGGAGAYLATQFEAVTGYPAIAVNTDKRSLDESGIAHRVLIGPNTIGQYGRVNPVLGKRAAEESQADLIQRMHGIKVLVLFIGLGGATGTSAAPVIAKLAHDQDIHVVAAVTLPFAVETARRGHAETGLTELQGTGATVCVYDHSVGSNVAVQSMASMEASFKRAALILGEAVRKELAGNVLVSPESSPAC